MLGSPGHVLDCSHSSHAWIEMLSSHSSHVGDSSSPETSWNLKSLRRTDYWYTWFLISSTHPSKAFCPCTWMKNQRKVENSHLYQTAQTYCVCNQTSLPSFMLHNIAMSCLTAPREATKSGRQPRHRPRWCPREKAKDNQLEPNPIPLSRHSKTWGCDISDDRPFLIITGSTKRS